MENLQHKEFEKHLKNVFQDYEAAFNKSDWDSFENKYDKAVKKSKIINKLKFATVAAFFIATAIALIYFNPFNTNTSQNKTETIIDNKLISENMPFSEIKSDVFESDDAQFNYADTKSLTHDRYSQPLSNSGALENVSEVAEKQDVEKKDVSKNVVPKSPVLADSNELYNLLDLQFLPALIIEPSKYFACANDKISFSPSIINNSYSYTWHFGDGVSSSEMFPVHSYSEGGVYEVVLQLNKKTGKEDMVSSQTVKIHKNPTAKFEYVINQESFGYPKVDFVDKSDGALQWQWDFDNGRFSYEQNPHHVFFIDNKKVFDISLSIVNEFGCKANSIEKIEFLDAFDLMAPNAFSPDGDGLNDYFIPKALETLELPFEMFIYDRAGNLVYNTKNKSKPWDGRVATTGLIPESGTFVWIVLITDELGKVYKYAGTVSIIK